MAESNPDVKAAGTIGNRVKLIRLFLKNPCGFDIRDQPVSVGVPLAAGAVRAVEDLELLGPDCRAMDHSASILSCWPDDSVRWLLVEFLARVDAGQQITLQLRSTPDSTDGQGVSPSRMASSDRRSGPDDSPPFGSEGVGSQLQSAGLEILTPVRSAESSRPDAVRSRFELQTIDGQRFELEAIEQCWLRRDTGHGAVLKTSGECRLERDSLPMRVTIEQTLYSHSAASRVEITLHNPNAALHPGGIWDLGDPGSLRFKACALIVRVPDETDISWRSSTREPWRRVETDRFSIVQASSGGEHWNSPVHVDEHGEQPPPFRGYRISDGPREVAAGDRCEPALMIESGAFRMTLRPERFWQLFPKALRTLGQECRMEMFPELDGVVHELQGGESSTSVFHFGFDEAADGLAWVDHPLDVSLERTSVFHSRVLRDWHDERSDARYTALLEKGLQGERSFFLKREMVDEYGWRHFGELYADHETWNQRFTGIFVSHYNNQYDPIYGFARQYLQTGDPRWFELMSDLARHVMDIDVYKTEMDRPEYNHGLFWHTDHYVQAHTATHRTYSRHQRSDRHEPRGGGPGGQHCYTSGLRLYHQLTGDVRARQTVFDLTRWMDVVYGGTGSILERTRESLQVDLPKLFKLIVKRKVLRYRYPLDRGVGNYIRALLDCFELDGEKRHLDQAGSVIRETAGPVDDIDERELHDIERTWFYTVFFQAVVAFLDVKRENAEFDADFHYARNTLLHYARWMLDNETPYLESPERLEYPNDTWAAQDARKAALLHAAYRYALEDRHVFLEKATEFKNYVITALEHSDTLHYTRIQVILLQNHGPVGEEWSAQPPCAIEPTSEHDGQSAYASVRSHVNQSAKAWARSLRTFSAARERAWLKHRLPRSGLKRRDS